MREKGHQGIGGEAKGEPRPYVSQPAMGSFFKKRGVYDNKLFCSMDKVTYTVVDENEVVSLHFDNTRQAIFYKGHNLENLKMEDIQVQHLEEFREAIERNPKTRSFAESYTNLLHNFLKRKSEG